jgi:hypothetical protein
LAVGKDSNIIGDTYHSEAASRVGFCEELFPAAAEANVEGAII